MQRPCGHLLSNLSTQRLTWLTNCLWLLSVHTEEIIHSQFSHLCHHIHSLWSLFGLGVSLPVDLHLKCVKSLRSMSNSGLYFDRKKTYTLYLTNTLWWNYKQKCFVLSVMSLFYWMVRQDHNFKQWCNDSLVWHIDYFNNGRIYDICK